MPKGIYDRSAKPRAIRRPLAVRVAEKIGAVNQNGCMEWTGALFSNGYGMIYRDGKYVGAHRVAFELARGPLIDSGAFVCHACDNPKCCNVDHLFLGSHAENMADKCRKGRANVPRGESHGRAKLTAEDVERIRRSDTSAVEVAKEFGVHPQHIRLIRRNKRIWLHA